MSKELAPDEVIVETDPWGDVRTYARFGQWTIETRMFDTGLVCSTDQDLLDAESYAAQWMATGVEPDMGSEPTRVEEP